jgi:internalin A
VLITGCMLESRYLITKVLTVENGYNLYLAEDIRLENTEVLIRETNIKDTSQGIENTLGEFKKKAAILVNQSNPGLPRFTDFFVFNSNFYLVMDYIEGNNLDRIIFNKEKVEEELIASWFLQLAGIFQHFHSQGLTITGDNLLKKLKVTSANELKLASLGVEDLIYVSNEAISADIYHIGLILYFLLTGESSNNSSIGKEKLEAVPDGLRIVLKKTLQSDPGERPKNVEELVAVYLKNNNKDHENAVNLRGPITRTERSQKSILKKITPVLISICILFLIVLFAGKGKVFTDQSLVFTDENLATEIKRSLGKTQAKTLTRKDVLEITELSLKEKGIESLEGIEYLENLKSLNLSNNNISDIAAIGELSKLEYLNLDFNKVNDISILANNTNVKELYISGNQISNIQSLKYLKKLITLGISINKISDITPLADLPAIRTLALSDNQIEDLKPLGNLTGLEKLYLRHNMIKEIDALSSLQGLQTLAVLGNPIKDISPLKSLTNLRFLELRDTKVENIDVLDRLENLRQLDLSFCAINDWQPIQRQIHLKELIISGYTFEDIEVVKNLTGLEVLNLSYNNLIDLTGIENLTKLVKLDLSNNNLQDISAINSLTNLEHLNLSNNKIIHIDTLDQLANLKYIDFRQNQIEDFSVISKYPLLSTWLLSDNPGF